ncbi:MAG TPA: hypothetical protein VMR95_02255 [Candidatus Binatia bacterium]|jgi:hypothetical protein|nr:hypothetical protein [Candidatus Binatia bacterium]
MVLDLKTKKPFQSHADKKRYGMHQSHNKSFAKAYWPYLPVFSIAGILIVVAGARVLGLTGAIVGSASVLIAGVSFII